ncbi:hypothetical protein ACRRTK_001072 [Alexandromys fortis]
MLFPSIAGILNAIQSLEPFCALDSVVLSLVSPPHPQHLDAVPTVPRNPTP